MDLIRTLLIFQSEEFWDRIEKCEIEEERQKSLNEIRVNAQKNSERMLILMFVGFLIAFLLKGI